MHKPPMILLSRSRREANHKASIPKTADEIAERRYQMNPPPKPTVVA
jgi:hypothetical protein